MAATLLAMPAPHAPSLSDSGDHFTGEDRKALNEIGVHMEYMRKAVDDLKSDGATKIASLEVKIERNASDIRQLQNFRWLLCGACFAGGAVPFGIIKLLGH